MVAIFMIEENVTVQNYSYSEYVYVFWLNNACPFQPLSYLEQKVTDNCPNFLNKITAKSTSVT